MSLNTDHELPEDLLDLERKLHGLLPVDISSELFLRLETSMIGNEDQTSATVESFEKLEIHLEEITPATMPSDMIDRMARAMDNWHEQVPVDEKLVAFNEGLGRKKKARKSYGLGMWGAAAVVALLGALSALVIPNLSQDAKPVIANTVVTTEAGTSRAQVNSAAPVTASSMVNNTRLVQDSLSHKVTNTSDQGVVLSGDNIPHRCIRVDYTDRVVIESKDGRQMEINRPGVEYILIPVEMY